MTEKADIQPFWERTYQLPDSSTFGEPSEEIVSLAGILPPGASILDLGCGEGRNALYLADRGFSVTAVDISENGIQKLSNLASERALTVATEVADMCCYKWNKKFDVIISHGCLHLVPRAEWERIIKKFKDYTLPGGFNVVAVFTDRIPPPPDMKDYCVGLFHEDELFAHYSDWRIQLQRSYTIHDEHPGGIRHTHPINKMVAQRAV